MSARTRAISRGVLVGAVAIAALMASSVDVSAQTARRGMYELGLSGVVTGPATFDSSSAELERPDGGALTLFRAENSEALGFGARAHIGVPVSSTVSVEVLGGWSRSNFRTRIASDFEGVANLTVAEPVTRFTVEGGAAWTFAGSAASAWFVRASGGWMRELAAGSIVADRSAIAHAGAGVKYWWRQPPRGLALGVRIEGGAALRWNGVSLGARRVHVAPGVTAGLILGS
jgi:hypothetical protein